MATTKESVTHREMSSRGGRSKGPVPNELSTTTRDGHRSTVFIITMETAAGDAEEEKGTTGSDKN